MTRLRWNDGWRLVLPVAILAMLVVCLLDPERYWALWFLVPLTLLALWDFFQRPHTLLRNFPITGHIRWIMEALRPYLRSYIVESDLDGRPFSIDERALVYARAKGDLDDHPMGTELDVYSSEYEWMTHSIAPNDSADENPRVLVGGPQCSKPYQASVLNISAMSFGSLGANAIEALNLGAKLGGFYHDTGEGGISRYHRKHGGDLTWEIGSGYFGCHDGQGHCDAEMFRDNAQHEQVRMIEIKLSQGAKPGHGGVLPGAKVTEEIAEARGVEVGQDCVSPAGHSAFSNPIEMLEWSARLRALSGGKPVGIKLCVGQPHEVMAIMKAMLETDILLDYIVVDGGEGGTGAAPVELSNRVGYPLREGLIIVRNALVGSGLKDRIKLAASGKVHSGAGLAANAALGADWCNAGRAFMFSLGCVQSMRCHTGLCPTGVATQNPTRQRGLVVEDKAERVARFHQQTVKALHMIMVSMGLQHPRDIRPEHFHERISDMRSQSIDKVYDFLSEGELLGGSASESYAALWNAAQASSFRSVAA